MIADNIISTPASKVSAMAETLIGSEIIKIAGEVNEKIRNGEKIFNLTIGDFDPKIFPIPFELQKEIINAYQAGYTNYPAANGIPELRKAVAEFIDWQQHLKYSTDEILIGAGARPLIYGVFTTLIDAGDSVIFPVPSWNNNHYCHLTHAKPIFVETSSENNFMPSAEDLKPYIADATMIALCSPLNPTGTIFSKDGLEKICRMVLAENKKRQNRKPLYILYDQIYSALLFGNNQHFDPVTLVPELKEYTIFIDGISKSLAATGVRVGWAFGPQQIMDKMRAILSHIGAWAPKAEQFATASYLGKQKEVSTFLDSFKHDIDSRLELFFSGIISLKKKGLRVDAIPPQAAIYLTVKLDLMGMKTQDGATLTSSKEVNKYLLDEAKIALVPFYAFGSSDDSVWYRLSVGTCQTDDIPVALAALESALNKLS